MASYSRKAAMDLESIHRELDLLAMQNLELAQDLVNAKLRMEQGGHSTASTTLDCTVKKEILPLLGHQPVEQTIQG